MTKLLREYTGESWYLAVHHPDEPGAKDDAPDASDVALLAASGGGIRSILVA